MKREGPSSTILSPERSHAFWDAINANDATATLEFLKRDPSLASARIAGEPWVAGMVWGGELGGGNVPAPEGFPFSNTALHITALNSRVSISKELLEHGSDPNAIGYERNHGLVPALVLAAWEGSLEMVRFLLENGADPNLPASCDGALYTAAEHGSREKVELLLEHGARHSIFTAAITGDIVLVERMLTAYPPLRDARSIKRSRTPYEEAKHHDQTAITELIGRDPECLDHQHR